MRITYLMMWGDDIGGLPRAVFAETRALARRHEVTIVSVLRTSTSRPHDLGPDLRLRYLLDMTQNPPQPFRSVGLDPARVGELSAAKSELVRGEQGQHFSRLTDLELEYELRTLETDVLVTTHPPLLELAATFAPSEVVLVHQEHRTSELRVQALPSLLKSAPRANAVTVLTDRTRGWLHEALGHAAPRVEVMPPPLDDQIRPRSALDSRVVVVASRLVEEKQIGHLIQAFGRLVDLHPDWRLRIFGSGPTELLLQHRITDSGLYNHVNLMGVTTFMAREWSKAAIGALSSRTEGFGLAILEAFAAGVPFVSYDSPNGPAEIITHGHDGLVVPLGSIEGLIQALDRLMSDDDERRAMGARAFETAKRYTGEQAHAELEALYAELLSQHRSGGALASALRRSALNPTVDLSFGSTVAPQDAERDTEATRAVGAANPELIAEGERLWHESAAITPEGVRRRNLDTVVDQLERADIPYVLLPDDLTFASGNDQPEARAKGPGGYRLAVEERYRARLLDALAGAYSNEGVYITPLMRGEDAAREVLVREVAGQPAFDACTGIAVTRYFLSPQRTLRFGATYRCEIELWARRDGTLVIPGRIVSQSKGEEVLETFPDDELEPAARTIGQRTYRSARPFVARRVGVVDFPIDVVYTWVDGGDPHWQQRRDAARAALEGTGHHEAATSSSRYRNHDELRYSLRSVAMNMPWVRHIFIVTDQQVPSWLDLRSSRISVVDHKEIFRDGDCLPTFNSHAIESQLHHIEGLSEHYLYMNDDFFIGRPVSPEIFFHSNGIAKFFLSPVTIPYGAPTVDDEPHFAAGKNCRALIEREFGCVIRRPFVHTPYPQLRSIMHEIEERFPEDVTRTAMSRFRNLFDVSMASNLHHYYSYLTGRAVPGSIKWMYMDVSNPEHQGRVLRLLRWRDTDTFCLNDLLSDDASAKQQEAAVHNLLERYFPFPSAFEADASGPTVGLEEPIS